MRTIDAYRTHTNHKPLSMPQSANKTQSNAQCHTQHTTQAHRHTHTHTHTSTSDHAHNSGTCRCNANDTARGTRDSSSEHVYIASPTPESTLKSHLLALLALLLTAEFEALATLDRLLVRDTAIAALQLQHDLLRGLDLYTYTWSAESTRQRAGGGRHTKKRNGRS